MGYLTRVLLLVCCAASLVRGWGQQLTFSGVTIPQQTATRPPTAPTATNPTSYLGARKADRAAVNFVPDNSWLGCLEAQKYKLDPIPGIYQASVQDIKKGLVHFVPSGTEKCGCQKNCPEVVALASGRLLQQRIAGGVVSNITALGTALRDKLVVGTGFSLLSGPLVASATIVKLEAQGAMNLTSGGSGGSRLDMAPDSVAVSVGNDSTRLLLQPLQSFFTTPNLYVVASGTGAGRRRELRGAQSGTQVDGVIDFTAASTLTFKAGQATTSVLTQDEIRQISAKWVASVNDTARLEAGGPFLLTSASTMSIHGGTAVVVSSDDTLTLHATTLARMTSDDRIHMETGQRMDINAPNIVQHAVDWALRADNSTVVETTTFFTTAATDATVLAGNILTLRSQNTIMEQAGSMHSLAAPLITQASDQWTATTTAVSTLSSDDAFYVAAGRLLHLSSDTVDVRVGNAMTVSSPSIMQSSDVLEVDSTASITWRSSNVSLYSDAYTLDSSDTVDVRVGNAMTVSSPSIMQSSDVLEVDSTVSITWRSSNVSLYSDAYTLDSSDTVDVRAGHTMTVSSPRVDVRASMAMTLTSPSVEIVSEDLRIESNQTVWSGAKLDVNVRSTAVTGDLILGNETAKGQLIMLNGKRPNLYETISANGETGDISSGRYHGCSSPSLGTSMKEGCTSHNPFFPFPMVTNK